VSLNTTVKSIQDIMRKDVGVDGDAQRIGHATGLKRRYVGIASASVTTNKPRPPGSTTKESPGAQAPGRCPRRASASSRATGAPSARADSRSVRVAVGSWRR
jgi:hypothetical protein